MAHPLRRAYCIYFTTVLPRLEGKLTFKSGQYRTDLLHTPKRVKNGILGSTLPAVRQFIANISIERSYL